MDFIKKLAGQTAIYGLSSVVPRLLNYILVVLYTRVFLPEEYGVITEMYAYLGFLLVFLTFGFETGFFRFSSNPSDRESVYSTAFLTLLAINILFFISISFFSNSLISALGYEGKPEYIIIMAAVIALDSISAIPFARLRLLNRPILFSTIKIIGVLVNVFFNIFFLIICPRVPFLYNSIIYNPDFAIFYVFLSNLISSIVTTALVLYFSGKLHFNFSYSHFKLLLVYSIPLLISGLGGTTNESFDRIFIKYLVPSDQNPLFQLGIYGSNVKLAVLMVLFVQMYRYAAEPFFFSKSNDKNSVFIYSISTKFFLAFSLLIFLFVGLFTDLLQFLVGKDFRQGLDVVPILLLANVFFGLFFNLSIWYKLNNKTWFGIYFTFTGAIVTILVNLLLIPKIGFYGAAWARLACYFVMCIMCFFIGRNYLKIPYDLKAFAFIFITALLIFSLGYFIHFSNPFLSYSYRLLLIFVYIATFVFYEKRFSVKQQLL
jgi:O-antigen/teichoic acid export membrane protein